MSQAGDFPPYQSIHCAMYELALVSRLFLGMVLVISGVSKLRHWRRFRDTLDAMELLSARLTAPTVWCLVCLELVLGLSLLAGTAPQVTAALVLCLLALFIVVLAWYRLRGNTELVCGCFADFEHKTPTVQLIVRNTFLAALVSPTLAVRQSPAGSFAVLDWVLTGFVCAGIVVAWSALVALGNVHALLRLEAAEG